jgi:hypothetical protein
MSPSTAPFDEVYIGGRAKADHRLERRQPHWLHTPQRRAQRHRDHGRREHPSRGRYDRRCGRRERPRGRPGRRDRCRPKRSSRAFVASRIAHDKIVGNVREGIALRLQPRGRLSLRADRSGVSSNEILGNYPLGTGLRLRSAAGGPAVAAECSSPGTASPLQATATSTLRVRSSNRPSATTPTCIRGRVARSNARSVANRRRWIRRARRRTAPALIGAGDPACRAAMRTMSTHGVHWHRRSR